MVPHRASLTRGLLLLPLFLSLLACPWDPPQRPPDDDDPEDPYKPPTSISNILDNLRLSYTNMDDVAYEKLLDDSYLFVFDPRDLGDEIGWYDETWGRSEEIDSARNMFAGQENRNGQVAQEIRLAFDAGQPQVSDENPEEWMMVILTGVDLAVTTIKSSSGDTWILQTPGGYEAHLHLIQTEEEFEDTGDRIWKIAMWEDKPPI